jgi:putative FmdB family regulatory protein
MPTYEYQCTACGHAFEKFQSIKAAPIKKCPECGKSKVKRLIGMGAGLLFKGSGFYITDYRGDSYSKAAKADAVFMGHIHLYDEANVDGVPYIISAGAGAPLYNFGFGKVEYGFTLVHVGQQGVSWDWVPLGPAPAA